MTKLTKKQFYNQDYHVCPHCNRKVIKEYPKSIHQRCLDDLARSENKRKIT